MGRACGRERQAPALCGRIRATHGSQIEGGTRIEGDGEQPTLPHLLKVDVLGALHHCLLAHALHCIGVARGLLNDLNHPAERAASQHSTLGQHQAGGVLGQVQVLCRTDTSHRRKHT